MKRGLFALALSLVGFAGTASADRIIQPERGDSINEDAGDLVARRPHNDLVVPLYPHVQDASGVTSNTIFMNKCTGGCSVKPGTDDSRTNTSSIVNRSGTLGAFPYSADVWTQVMACMQGTFTPFNVVITDVDPGTANHLEVFVGSSPQNLGFDSTTGGVAPFDCEPYVSNALVFDFAGIWGEGTTCDTQCVVNICATAAQEIAHTWSLDHVTDATDPMTYYGQDVPTPRHYKDAEDQCGSDCQGGQGPLQGETCSGPGTENHACYCSGAQTQNSYATILALFGGSAPTPPIVTIQDPANGASVAQGFPIHTTVTDSDGVDHVELRIDGTLTSTLTAGPYYFNAPTNLANGTHHVEITGYDIYQASANAFIDVVIGMGCTSPSDCPMTTDTCVGGACVPGSGVAGGLGAPCTDSTQCLDGQCASGNMGMVCVVSCTTGACPSGYGCVTASGAAMGVCYPGFDDGSGSGGGCLSTTGASSGGGLVFAAFIMASRRRRRKT